MTLNLPTDLTENNVRIFIEEVFEHSFIKDNSLEAKSRGIRPAKNLNETYELVRKAIDNYEVRANLATENRILFTEEEPDVKLVELLQKDRKKGVVSFGVIRRIPGAFAQGRPFEADVRNLKPMIREQRSDPENPGYKLVTVGYYHDNLLRFTCWAQTNKTANEMAMWFEDLMDEYMWYFKAEGVDRFIYQGRGMDTTKEVQGNKWYGRPIDYFVRTEKIKVFSEKKLEEILIKVSTKQE